MNVLIAPYIQSSVAFTLTRAQQQAGRIPVTSLLTPLKAEIEANGFTTTPTSISSLGYGAFGVPLSVGRIGISIWPDTHSETSWQIWIRYSLPKLKRLLRVPPPPDLNEKLEDARRIVERFLHSNGAQDIQWISVKEADARLPK